MKNKIFKIFIFFLTYYFLFVFFIYISLRFFINFNNMPNFNKIEAIIVLAGGKGRIDLGKKLLKSHKNIFFIISGANPEFSLEFIKKKLELSGKNIIIENKSKNTIENGYEVKKIIEKLGIKNILLITSKSHMIRALIIFKMILPKGTKIFPYAVNEKITFLKVLKENFKIIFFILNFLIKGV